MGYEYDTYNSAGIHDSAVHPAGPGNNVEAFEMSVEPGVCPYKCPPVCLGVLILFHVFLNGGTRLITLMLSRYYPSS